TTLITCEWWRENVLPDAREHHVAFRCQRFHRKSIPLGGGRGAAVGQDHCASQTDFLAISLPGLVGLFFERAIGFVERGRTPLSLRGAANAETGRFSRVAVPGCRTARSRPTST